MSKKAGPSRPKGLPKGVTRLGNFQLLEPIGKGGFGMVYRGLNIETGTTVAIKTVRLEGIGKEDLESIETEIKLLQNLTHRNIVKYIDAIRSHGNLNIILEYVENGSLAGMLTNFGSALPESLVCHYIAQVLQGLDYLHDQGVIHRDIKGANILSTKDGTIKLADFGVATKLTESRKSDSVVGTPYWMAPEIIEMTGQQSSACDIWSVGCTVVELLTGKPPYFDLQQMPALFRIVQDEHPPLPHDISPALESFLMDCFQKDPNRRIDAKGLLKHPWLKHVVPSEELAEQLQGVVRQPKNNNNNNNTAVNNNNNMGDVAANIGGGFADNIDDIDDIDDLSDLSDGQDEILVPTQRLVARPDDLDDLEALLSDMDEDEDLQQGAGGSGGGGPGGGPGDDESKQGEEEATSFPTGRNQLDSFVERDVDESYNFDDEDHIDEAVLVDEEHRTPWDLDGKEIDPFDDIQFEDLDDHGQEDAKVSKALTRILADLVPQSDEKLIVEACEKLSNLVKEHPERTRALMSTQGVIPVVEMLEANENTSSLHAVLRVVNEIIDKNVKFQQALSLVGLVPAIIRFAGREYPHPVRMEAANFIRQFCYASDFTRKMFIACGGISVLVECLQVNYSKSKTLVWNAVDCVGLIFEITTNPRNDFCRLFCKFGLLVPLTKALVTIHADQDSPDAPEYVVKIARILYMFSQADSLVKSHFAQPDVLEGMLRLLTTLPQQVLILVLKSILNIAMDPAALDLLELSGAIPCLVPLLNSPHAENQNQVLQIIYYLCQIKQSRQEQAISAGVIPPLKRFIEQNHPLKQFAYPLIFMLAKTTMHRLELKKQGGVQFYIDALDDVYWRTFSLEVLAVWLQDDKRRVGFQLCTPSNLNKLLAVFKGTQKAVQFEKMLPLFFKILSTSIRVNQAFGRSRSFLVELLQRLERNKSNNIRINLLKILALVFVAHQQPAVLIREHALLPLLTRLSKDRDSVIVMSLSTKLRDMCLKIA